MLEKGDWKFVQCTSRPFATEISYGPKRWLVL